MIKLPAYLLGFSSKSDGSAGIRFSTQELSPDDFSQLKRYLNAYGWLIFDEADIADEEIPDDIPDDKKKTPAQRLRSTLYVLWKETKVGGDFNTFYRHTMDKITEHYKSKIPDSY